jgi:hypothetical protein
MNEVLMAYVQLLTGYVEQNDTLLPELSVREMLLYTAGLALPRKVCELYMWHARSFLCVHTRVHTHRDARTMLSSQVWSLLTGLSEFSITSRLYRCVSPAIVFMACFLAV